MPRATQQMIEESRKSSSDAEPHPRQCFASLDLTNLHTDALGRKPDGLHCSVGTRGPLFFAQRLPPLRPASLLIPRPFRCSCRLLLLRLPAAPSSQPRSLPFVQVGGPIAHRVSAKLRAPLDLRVSDSLSLSRLRTRRSLPLALNPVDLIRPQPHLSAVVSAVLSLSIFLCGAAAA
jgi:hypothetical protein